MGEVRKRKPKGAKGEAWGILNPFGDLWTYETFASAEEATAYVANFWRSTGAGGDLSRFKPIRVKVHVTALTTTEPSA